MNKKRFFVALGLFLVTSAIVFAQVCVVSTVSITGWGTKTVTFTNNGTNSQFVKVEVKWEGGTRIFGRDIPAGKYVGPRKNQTFVPGTLTENVAGVITFINECP